MLMTEFDAFLPFLRLIPVLAIFLLPGYGWVCWLHRRDGLHASLRWVLAFAWSTAIFGIVSGPFLWLSGTLSAFLSVLYPVWAIYALLGAILYLRRSDPTAEPETQPLNPAPHEEPGPAEGAGRRALACVLLLLYLAIAVVPAYEWVAGVGVRQTLGFPRSPRWVIVRGGVFLLMALYGLAWLFRRAARWLIDFGADDEKRPPAAWKVVALGMILFQAATAALYIRHSRDDGYYLAAVLDYEQGGTLNAEEPTHREGLPVSPIHRTMCWELLGAVVCRLTGLAPMVLFRTVLPAPLVLAAYAAYAALFAEYLPRRWVPIALIGLSGVHLWGITNNETAINFLLPRPWQGKTVLIHIAIPLLSLALARYMRRPATAWWATLATTILFGLAVSLSAIFMMVIQVVCLTAACFRNPNAWRLSVLARIGIALAPLVGVALLLRAGALPDSDLTFERFRHVRSFDARINHYLRAGSVEVLWVFCVPLLAALLVQARRKEYLVVFPVVLGLTFANPLLYHVVSRTLTSYVTYERVWWLFPVGPGLGALLALIARFLTISLRRPGSVVLPILFAVAGLAASWFLPGIYVWSESNVVWGPMQKPRLADTLEKIPADLRALAQEMANDPEITSTRILCSEAIATELVCYRRDFRFVQTRPMYTEGFFGAAHRPGEGQTRNNLAAALAGAPPAMVPQYGPLFSMFRVKYVITGPGDAADPVLVGNGYEVVDHRGEFVLWKARWYVGPAHRDGSGGTAAARPAPNPPAASSRAHPDFGADTTVLGGGAPLSTL
jgi:hypothetical protein